LTKKAAILFISIFLPCMAKAMDPESLPPVPAFCQPAVEPVRDGMLREWIEQDWIESIKAPLTTQSDAAGGCDGIKNGCYGFHVGHEPHPWWQVDLGATESVGRIVVYNRLDYAPGLHNADSMRMYASLDGTNWTLFHDNHGHHFGGIHGAPPLEVTFGGPGLIARFIRLAIPSDNPVFFHLDEVEVYAAGNDAVNIALGKPADQSSLSPWSTVKVRGSLDYPTAAQIERGRRFAAFLETKGIGTADLLESLDEMAGRLEAMPRDASDDVKRALFLDVRWIVRQIAFRNPDLDFDRLLFVKRFTQETYPDVCLNHMPWVSRPGGGLFVLERASKRGTLLAGLSKPAFRKPQRPVARLRNLLNGALGPGHVHGIDLWFEGDRVVFGYARARSDNPPDGWLDRTQSYRLRRTEPPIHLFELRLGDYALRQITAGEWSDLDPAYAPNGDIVFVSERCGTSLQCNEYDKDETSCNLYVMRPDGRNIRRMSVNKDGDYLPHCLDNGLIAYTRWEYHERSWAFIQSIWTIRPDGAGADALFKQHFVNPWALEDIRSIPGGNKLVAIATGHHTLAAGPLVIVNHNQGLNEPRGIGIVSPHLLPPEGGMEGVPVPEGGTDDAEGYYSTPWALSETTFLAAYTHSGKQTDPTGYSLYLVDVYGNKELIYRDPAISCFYPIPLRPRPIPTVLPDLTDRSQSHATCIIADIAYGNEEIPPGEIRYLRISEPIGWPYDNVFGGHRYGEDHRYGGPGAERMNLTSWTPIRILGDVPIEADGSVQFDVPADTAVYFQLLDKNRMELRRMRSFISFQPGELRSCMGCHESRNEAPAFPSRPATPMKTKRKSAAPIPPPWGGDRPISFLRDVQPVLDKHCAGCHAGLNPAGGLDFSGGLLAHDDEVPGYGHNRAFDTILANQLVSISEVRAQDAGITPPYAYGARKSRLITALDDERHTKRVAVSAEDRLRLTLWIDANAPYHDRFVNKRPGIPPYDIAADRELRDTIRQVHARRCAGCHEVDAITRLDWIDLAQPRHSRFLMAPLAEADGGNGRCSLAVYQSIEDGDYVRIHDLVTAAVARAWERPRRDLEALNPPR